MTKKRSNNYILLVDDKSSTRKCITSPRRGLVFRSNFGMITVFHFSYDMHFANISRVANSLEQFEHICAFIPLSIFKRNLLHSKLDLLFFQHVPNYLLIELKPTEPQILPNAYSFQLWFKNFLILKQCGKAWTVFTSCNRAEDKRHLTLQDSTTNFLKSELCQLQWPTVPQANGTKWSDF